jgi:hypothetical protein
MAGGVGLGNKLNELPYCATVRCFGVTLGLRAASRAQLRRFAQAWPYGCEPCDATHCERWYAVIETPQHRWRLYANSRKVAECDDAAELKRRLRAHAQLFIAATSEQYVFIHAGVVAWNEQAIVIPGRSYSGKTTLVAEFVKAGATYYSDEYALLDQEGRVHPYPRPLSVRAKLTGIQRDVASARLGGEVGTKPLPVKLILLTKYQAGAEWNPVQAETREASKGLALNAVAIRRFPLVTVKAIARASLTATVWQGVRGEATALVKSVKSLFTSGAGS